MKPHFLFPASPLDSLMIDEAFQDQAIALKMAGFECSVLTDDMKIIGPLSKIDGDPDVRVIYRGWMMDTENYQGYLEKLAARPVVPLTSMPEYLAAHHLPNWYSRIERHTPKSAVFPNTPETPEDVCNFCAGAFAGVEGVKLQIKDYVKSLKTGSGSVVTSADEVREVLANMQKYRGTIEGGIVVRWWEDFFPGSEVRYFVINGRYYGEQSAFDIRAMRILEDVKGLIPSPFWSIDIAMRVEDGEFRVVEIGDGQVSDLVGWTEQRFAQVWQQATL